MSAHPYRAVCCIRCGAPRVDENHWYQRPLWCGACAREVVLKITINLEAALSAGRRL